MLRRLLTEKNIHTLFRISLYVKFLDAAIETLAGILALFVTHQTLLNTMQLIAAGELAEDPHDLVIHLILQWIHRYSVRTQMFLAFYLMAHGLVKIWLVIGLLREKLWYYPTALVVFFLFILYQLYRFTFNHPLWLLVLTVVDMIVIGLTIHEYRYLRQHIRRQSR